MGWRSVIWPPLSNKATGDLSRSLGHPCGGRGGRTGVNFDTNCFSDIASSFLNVFFNLYI